MKKNPSALDADAAYAAVAAAHATVARRAAAAALRTRVARCADRTAAACAKARTALVARGLSNEAIDLEIQAAVMRLFDDDARA